MTQAEIAQRLGMSQMHVSRLLRQALGTAARGRPGRGTRSAEPPGAPIMAAMTAPPARLLG